MYIFRYIELISVNFVIWVNVAIHFNCMKNWL